MADVCGNNDSDSLETDCVKGDGGSLASLFPVGEDGDV